jgi:hypothetical protein
MQFQQETHGESSVPFYNNKSDGFSTWFDPKLVKEEFLRHESLLQKRQRVERHYILDGIEKKPKITAREGPNRINEDHPDLAIEREKLLEKCLDLLASENEKYGPMTDDSKTSISCRRDGMRKGMQGFFGRIVWFELLEQISRSGDIDNTLERDSIFPVHFIGDENVMKELVAAGRSTEASRDIVLNKMGQFMMKCARHLIEMKKQLLPKITTPLPIRLSKIYTNDNTNTIQTYQLSYNAVNLQISYSHFKKLLRLYRLHTDPAADLQDGIFVSPHLFILFYYFILIFYLF